MAARQRQKLDFLGGEEVDLAPEADLPRTTFFSIEYPAILGKHAKGKGNHVDEHPALSNALQSLSPQPHPYASPLSALRHIGQLVEKSGRVTIECRLGQACLDAEARFKSKSDPSDDDTPGPSTNDVYRHAILGDVVDAHNVVLKVTKRVWRKKRRNNELTLQSEGDTERKEYVAVAMGITRRVARFRNLADFLYDPGYVDGAEGSVGKEEATKQALSFYDGMRQMDIDSLRSLRLDQEKEDYEIQKEIAGKGEMRISNIRLPPPSIFDKTEVPFIYGFRQNPSSYLGSYGQVQADGTVPMRYMNKLKFENMAPIQYSMATKSGRDKTVPMKSRDGILESRTVDEELFAQVKQLFDKQPIWTRISLYNQFERGQRRNLINQKQYLAASCYAITDGCWRDTLVRFGYDPRKEKDSRFYQRISFQMKSRNRRYATLSKQASTVPEPELVELGGRIEVDAAEEETDVADFHIFDGVTPNRVRGNYLLIDVQDEYVKPLIYQTGEEALRDEPDRDTGWYTQKQFDKIRSVLQVRFHRLLDDGVPATKGDCDAIIAQIEGVTTSKPVKSASRARRPTNGSQMSP